jgi:hypothetical protein
LAALELGRIRLSELDDPSGALEAFEDVVKLEPSGLFREDADARIVQALEAAGQREPCMEARDRYLKTYPHGAHALTVARRCPTE